MKKAEDRPKDRVKGGGKPVCEDGDENHHEPREENGENGDKTGHGCSAAKAYHGSADSRCRDPIPLDIE